MKAIYPSRWYRLKRFLKSYDQEILILAAILAIVFALLKLVLR